jgi:hypothetical protein
MSPQQKSAWFDEASHTPIIAEKARQAESFIAAMADGVIEESELQAQESRLIELMRKIEPQLPGALHDQVTDLLCELTVHNFMQAMRLLQEAKPKKVFQG